MYRYSSPLNRGYKQIKMNRKQFKELFPNRQYNIFLKKYIYVNTDTNRVTIENCYSIFGKVIMFIVLPINAVYEGFSNFSLKTELEEIFRQRQTGHFYCDYYEGKQAEKIINFLK